MALLIFAHWNNSGNLLSRLQLEKVDNRRSSCGSGRLRNLVCFQTVDSSRIRKEHEVMMGRRHQKLLDVVVLDGLHALDSLAAAVLAAEVVNGHTFDIAQFRHGDDGILARNQILHGEIVLIKANGSSSVIAVFFGYGQNLPADNAKKHLAVCEDGF